MAFFIRDAEVDALAEELRNITKAKSKTEAVRLALREQLAAARRALPLKERLARSKALADAMGPSDPAFDMKAYTDEMWGEPDVHRRLRHRRDPRARTGLRGA